MRYRIALSILLFTSCFASAGNEQEYLFFKVMKGDTFIRLFGSDWEKAWNENKIWVVRDGELVSSPDILIEGVVLRVPSTLQLTHRAAVRLEDLRRQRQELLQRLQRLKATPRGSALPDYAPRLADCEHLLADETRFAQNVEVAETLLAQLEMLTRARITSTRQHAASHSSSLWLGIAGVSLDLPVDNLEMAQVSPCRVAGSQDPLS